MKITCQACAAKYTIADEKVLGKVVKIRCKKCGATIVINGNDPSAGAEVGGAESQGLDYASGGSPLWTVNVADGDQRTMTDHEVVSAYRAGVVTDEAYCWKDGMPDWLPLREIAQLHAACTAAPGAGPTDPPEDDGATKVQDPPAFLLAATAPQAQPAYAAAGAHGGGNGSGASHAPEAPAAAARRAPGRAPAADLFGGVAQAGGEDDVMTSAPAGMPQPHDDGARDKLTGARNENSVLFSLNALTSKGGVVRPQPMPASAEASGLIDIRQLSAQIGLGDDKKQSRIDDIMNLAGGGAFSPSLSAPVLSAPPIEEYTPQASLSPTAPPRSKKIVFAALGAGAFVVVAAVGGAMMLMHRGPDETADNKDKPSASAAAESASGSPSASASAAAPEQSVAKNDQPAPSDSAAASGGQGGGSAPASMGGTAHEHEHAAAKSSTPHESAPKENGSLLAAATASDAPFNMGEAKARLAAIATGAQSCKKGDLSGTGRVVVVFAPNGSAQSATISGPPFEGTPTGTCVAARFRGARVPAFGGSPFSVAKSFTIN